MPRVQKTAGNRNSAVECPAAVLAQVQDQSGRTTSFRFVQGLVQISCSRRIKRANRNYPNSALQEAKANGLVANDCPLKSHRTDFRPRISADTQTDGAT